MSSLTRAVSDKFFDDLKTGILSSLTERVKRDDTLLLALRGNYVNIYYRGGAILKIEETGGGYNFSFDKSYAGGAACNLPEPYRITKREHCDAWIGALPSLKEIMNAHMSEHRKSEREFQQLVAWENNRSVVSNETEYFITDIEYAVSVDGCSMRADMLGLKWKAGERSGYRPCVPVIIEMKYGTGAFSSTHTSEKKGSGIKDHFDDVCHFFGVADSPSEESKERTQHFKEMIGRQFQQLWKLGLIHFNESKAFKANDGLPIISGKPEFVFLLANDNPRSVALRNAISSIPDEQIQQAEKQFDLRFFAARFAGYGMHDVCMLTRNQMLDELKNRPLS